MQRILPWHESAWQYLVNRINIGKLPHAILIKGITGVGKLLFAKNLSSLLLCQDSSYVTSTVSSVILEKTTDHELTACGECDACLLLQANNHPDLIMIEPQEPGKAIKIDQIREVIADLRNTSHQGGMKIVIIEHAELLNVAAANALLKTLEEPAMHTVIILVSAHPMLLSATIRSRCQILSLHAPKYIVAESWLKQQIPDADVSLLLALAENAPLQALKIEQNGILPIRQEFFTGLYSLLQNKIGIIQMVEQCLEWRLDDLLLILMYIASDLLKIKLHATRNIVNKDQIEMLSSFALVVGIKELLAYKDRLDIFRKHLLNKINLNQQMVMENLIVTWLQLFRS